LAEFVDIQIRIRALNEATGAYPVEASLDDGSHFGYGELRLDRQALLEAALDPKEYGLGLFYALFSGSIRRAYDQSTGRAQAETEGRLRVRLWIDSDATELHALSWERMVHLHKGQPVPLSTSALTPFSRYTGLEIPDPQPITDRPIRFLFAIANPNNLPASLKPIPVEEEVASLRQALESAIRRGEVQVTILPGRSGLSPDLRAKLETEGYEVADGVTGLENILRLLPGCHVLHFLGHGHFRREGQTGEGTAALYLEEADGSWAPVRDEELTQGLANVDPQPRLVFLAACESAKREPDATNPFVGLGPKLVRAGVPAVVAMQDQIPMDLARRLTGDFYRKLLEHGVVDRAMNEARNLLFKPDQIDWATPVLFMRLVSGQLLAGDPLRKALQEIGHWAQIEGRLPLPIDVSHLAGPQEPASLERFGGVPTPARDLAGAALGIFAQQPTDTDQDQKGTLIVLVGGQGMAKTTQLRGIAERTAKDSLSPASERRIIPVWVDLKDYPKVRAGARNPVETLILDNLKQFWQDLSADVLSDVPGGEDTLILRVLVDGSDDLSDRQRREAWREFQSVVRSYPQHQYMLAVDSANYDPRRLKDATDLLVIQPLSVRTIEGFLKDVDDPAGARLHGALQRTQLFDLAAIPWLLVKMLEQARAGIYPRSRTEVLQGLFEDAMADIPLQHGMRSRAARALYTLAWEMQSDRNGTWPIEKIFGVMDSVRGTREYKLEDLAGELARCGLLAWVGQEAMRFTYPAYQSYCCAMYINNLEPEARERVLDDITASLGRLTRLRWWEETLVLLSGLMRNPNVLLRKLLYGATFGQEEQVFVAVRCLLEGSPQRIDRHLRDQVVDALAWRLDSANVRQNSRRARAASALGRLQLPSTIPYLSRVANQPVRIGSDGELVYESSSVRMAACIALQRMMPQFSKEIRATDAPLAGILDLWREGNVEALDTRLRSRPKELQPIVAFALGDLQTREAGRALITAFRDPRSRAVTRWAVADALTLHDPAWVARQAILPFLDEDIAREDGTYDSPAWKYRASQYERLAYLIGRIRAVEPAAREFLRRCLFEFRSVGLKGRAIQSLGWLYEVRYKELFERIATGDLSDIAPERDLAPGDVVYLRREAIEALANLGDRDTLTRLREGRAHWARELEQAYYETSEEISWRMSLGADT
jgi:HEAT repeat protein